MFDGNPLNEMYGYKDAIFCELNSQPNKKIIDTGSWILSRIRNTAYLLYVYGDWNYSENIDKLTRLGVTELKCKPMLKPEPTEIRKEHKKVYFCSDLDTFDGRRLKRIKRAMRDFTVSEVSRDGSDTTTLLNLIDVWKDVSSKHPGHMITPTGMYKAQVRHYPTLHESLLWKMFRVGDTKPCGLIGGFFSGSRGVALQAKHDFRYKYAGDAVWGHFIQLMQDMGVRSINCGYSANKTKEKMGMGFFRAWNLPTQKFNLENKTQLSTFFS